MMLSLDDKTMTMLDMLAEHDRKEPPEPDSERHPTEQLVLLARRRNQWEEKRWGLWLMVAGRLADQAIYEYPDAV